LWFALALVAVVAIAYVAGYGMAEEIIAPKK
jgi:hypothetical protein